MSEYWKSIPKKFCDVCKVWFQDNRASVEHHERGLRHKANVQKKLNELRKRGATQLQEQKDHAMAIMKIEAAAMSSFHNDVAADPSLASQMGTSSSGLNHLPTIASTTSSSSLPQKGRFGEDLIPEESRELVRGRERALETVAKKLEKKSKWLEAKTSEGDVYYWNRDTLGTVHEKPKDGFLSITEQEATAGTRSTIPESRIFPPADADQTYSPYGQWKPVEDPSLQMPDLQLPVEDAGEEKEYQPVPNKEPEIRFEEKVVEKRISTGNDTFKKRQVKSGAKRNVRRRESSP